MAHCKEKEIGTQTPGNSLKVTASELQSLHPSGLEPGSQMHRLALPYAPAAFTRPAALLEPFCLSLDLFTF